MDIDEFKVKFKEIRESGYYKSRRAGPTGVGHTLEQCLGLVENNIAVPDLGNVELKAHRDNCNSLITLFTFNRRAWIMKPLEAIKTYGTPDANGRLGLYFTMSQQPNSAGLFLTVTDELVSVQHISGKILVCWLTKDLSTQFRAKMPALVLVTARTELRGDTEYFSYYKARLLTGTSPELIADQIRRGNILVDLRLHDAITRARNHGTGFRASESSLDELFTRVETL